MKIIHVVLGKANPFRANGVNKVVHSLACWLDKNKISTQVWGITDTPFANTPDRPYPLKLFKTPGLPFQIPDKLTAELKKLSTDTRIHFHGVLIPVFSNIASFAKKTGIPYIITPHSALTQQALSRRNFKKNLYIKLLEKSHLENAGGIQALAEDEAENIKKIAPKASIVTIPNGIDFKKTVVPCHHPLHSTEKPVFGFVGRIEKHQKGLDILLEGFAAYHKNNKSGRLTIVGNGPDMQWLKNTIYSMNISDAVTVTGPLFDKDLEDIRQTMTMVAYPSRWEGISMAVLEALAMGSPAIVSKETNIGDLIVQYNAGWQMEQNTVEQLTSALHHAHEICIKGNLNDFSFNAQKLIHTKFSWNHIGNRIIKEIYEPAANG